MVLGELEDIALSYLLILLSAPIKKGRFMLAMK